MLLVLVLCSIIVYGKSIVNSFRAECVAHKKSFGSRVPNDVQRFKALLQVFKLISSFRWIRPEERRNVESKIHKEISACFWHGKRRIERRGGRKREKEQKTMLEQLRLNGENVYDKHTISEAANAQHKHPQQPLFYLTAKAMFTLYMYSKRQIWEEDNLAQNNVHFFCSSHFMYSTHIHARNNLHSRREIDFVIY